MARLWMLGRSRLGHLKSRDLSRNLPRNLWRLLSLAMVTGAIACGSAYFVPPPPLPPDSAAESAPFASQADTAEADPTEADPTEADPTEAEPNLLATEQIAAEQIAAEQIAAEQIAAEQVAVIGVDVSGQPQAYTFSVTLQSQETGCEGYADWWEVITLAGELRYRRILAHSHVDEQPFTRSGGPVALDPDEIVIVRGHFTGADSGYGAITQRGSVNGGFQTVEFAAPVAPAIANQPPLPESCAF